LDNHVFRKPAVPGVPDSLPVEAPVFLSLEATLAGTAGVGQEGNHRVSRLQGIHILTYFDNRPGNLMAQHNAGPNSTAQHTRHHQ
jgi:hypothetical protein